MAQDPNGNVVMFGGVDAGGNMFDDTWIWDGTNWNLQNTPAGLAARRAPLVYDPATNNVVLFGGEGSYGGPTFGDTWVWDGANWTQQFPDTTPPPRSMASMAYDSFMSRLVLFGGLKPDLATQTTTRRGRGMAPTGRSSARPVVPRQCDTLSVWFTIPQLEF